MNPQSRESLQQIKPYVPGKSKEEIKALYGLENIVKLASNENPLGVPKKSQEAIKNHLAELFQYPQGHSPELTSALTTKLGLDMDQVVFSNGSDEMVQMVCNTFLNSGDITLCSENTFSEYKFSTLVCGAIYQTVPLKDWCYDLEAMLEAIEERTKLIFVCNPNNPTGTWRSHQDIINFLDRVPSHVMVIVDEAYVEYADDPQFPSLLKELSKRKNLIILRTFSKLYGLAGLRVGYALSHADVVHEIKRVKQPFNVNLLAQIAAEAALSDSEHTLESLRVNREGLTLIRQVLDRFGWEYLPTQGNFITFKVGEQGPDYVKTLESQGLISRSLSSFGLEEWVRLTVGLDTELELWKNLSESYYDQNF